MKKTVALCLCLAVLAVSACSAKPLENRYQAEFLSLFDTMTVVVGYAEGPEQFKQTAQEIHDTLEQYHRLYDIYNDYEGQNNLKTVNDNAGVAPVAVDGRIIALLQLAKEMHAQSGGAINVAMGSVLKIWHRYREAGVDDPENAALPPMALLREAAGHTDIGDVVIDEAASTVYLRDPGMSLDVGAIGKGYAVEQTALRMEERGVTSLLLSVGGNVRAIGGKRDAGPGGDSRWKIAIQDPFGAADGPALTSVLIEGLSVVSSGTYERYYTVDGVRYHHIIDPQTQMPAERYAQVTVICRDSGLADALSTVVFNKEPEAGLAYIEGLDGVEAAWVLLDGSVFYSNGFGDYLQSSGK